MIVSACQRWRTHRSSYRPAGETIRTSDYEVAPIERGVARAFVEAHHYSRSWPAARLGFGLLRRGGELAGVAVTSQPMHEAVLAPLPGHGLERAELGRFVLLDDVPANGETWMLARVFELLAREGLVALIAFSDPVPRADDQGRVVFRGHVGTIYRASNAVYTGRGHPATLRLLPDGTVLSPRGIQKIRAGERGWRPVHDLMVSHGAAPMLAGQDPRAWLRDQLPRFRTFRHPGNLRYLFGLDRSARKTLARRTDRLPYPQIALPEDA